MVPDATLLKTQHYKLRIMGNVEQSKESSCTFLIHFGVVGIERGAFESPSNMVATFTYL